MSTTLTEWKVNMLKAASMWPGYRPFCAICQHEYQPADGEHACDLGVTPPEAILCKEFHSATDDEKRIADTFYHAGYDDGVAAAEED